ncbi:unnamed protein product, partial [Musa acuminata subsp. burmannicoides]
SRRRQRERSGGETATKTTGRLLPLEGQLRHLLFLPDHLNPSRLLLLVSALRAMRGPAHPAAAAITPEIRVVGLGNMIYEKIKQHASIGPCRRSIITVLFET